MLAHCKASQGFPCAFEIVVCTSQAVEMTRAFLDAGSQVHYRSSSDAPVLVQGRSGAVAAEQAGNDVDWDKQVRQYTHSVPTITFCSFYSCTSPILNSLKPFPLHSPDGNMNPQVQDRIGVSNTQRPDLLQGPDAVTQDLEASLRYVRPTVMHMVTADKSAFTLLLLYHGCFAYLGSPLADMTNQDCRHEEQQLHEARSQVADLWAVIAAADQPAILPSAEDAVPSVPELEWTTDMPTTPHQAQTSITHTTSL